jgi:hypothetical protein
MDQIRLNFFKKFNKFQNRFFYKGFFFKRNNFFIFGKKLSFKINKNYNNNNNYNFLFHKDSKKLIFFHFRKIQNYLRKNTFIYK